MFKPRFRCAGLCLGLLALLALMGCDRPRAASASTERAPGPLRIVVTIPPLLWAVRELAPPDAQITLILAPGQSEHGFEITPSQFKAINDADLVVMVGYGLEPKVESTLKLGERARRKVLRFESVEGISPIVTDPEHEGCTDPSHHHEGVFDPHVWLDPLAMRSFVLQLGAMMEQLSGPADGARIREATAKLAGECVNIDAAYREQLAKAASKVIVTHHNAYAYVARKYGLEVAAVIRPIEVIEPTPGDIKAVTEAVRERGVTAIFVEPQFSGVAAERIANSVKVRILPLDPLGDGDWAQMMRRNLDALVKGLNNTP